MKIFLIVLRSCPLELGELGLQSFKVESIIQVINYLISLYMLDTTTKLLIKTAIKYTQTRSRVT